MKPHVADLITRLRPWANQLAARFGHPVFLVGSALEEEDPRDVDVVCILPSLEFWGRYGGSLSHEAPSAQWKPGSLRWGRDMAKLGAYASQHLGVNVDLKVQADYLADHRFPDRPRERIDNLDLEDHGEGDGVLEP